MSDSANQERDIDIVIRQVHQHLPEAEVVQLRVKWPADDNNLWWFSLPEVEPEIQVERACCPFLVETDEQCSSLALKAMTVDEAVTMIVNYLQSAKAGSPIQLAGELYWSKDYQRTS